VDNQPVIIKHGAASRPWKPINLFVELNRSVNRLCKLTDTLHLQVYSKVSQPVTFTSDRLLIRSVIDNIVFTAIHDTEQHEVPLLDIAMWVDKNFAHIEVKKTMPRIIPTSKKNVYEHFFRSFVYGRKYNFGIAAVKNAIGALKGSMEVSVLTSELLLTIHLANHASLSASSEAVAASPSAYPAKNPYR